MGRDWPVKPTIRELAYHRTEIPSATASTDRPRQLT
jgi:hypothetical protein